MKDKEVEGFIEKTRKFRDRSKKRRLSNEEKAAENSDDIKPRMEPYRRTKNWVGSDEE